MVVASKEIRLQVIDWQVIINKHGPAVWRVAYRLLGNHADAADCFQETFVSALEFCRRQHVRNFSALLAQFATARAIDQLRRRFRRSNSKTNFADWAGVQSANRDPAKQAQQQELAARLRESLTRLSPQEAQAFCLRYLNDMSYRQIAKALGIKTNAAGVLLHRARAKLRESFESPAKSKSEVVL
jgi:RNA polymerase sigma-70 factor (ECF subfamily)